MSRRIRFLALTPTVRLAFAGLYGAPVWAEVAASSASPSRADLPLPNDMAAPSRVAVNTVRALLAGFLVMFMQAGFAMVETRFRRAKNIAHAMAMNLMIYGIGMLLDLWFCIPNGWDWLCPCLGECFRLKPRVGRSSVG